MIDIIVKCLEDEAKYSDIAEDIQIAFLKLAQRLKDATNENYGNVVLDSNSIMDSSFGGNV